MPRTAILALSASIELGSSPARVTSVVSQEGGVLKFQATKLTDWTPDLPGSDKNMQQPHSWLSRLAFLANNVHHERST